MTYSKGLRDAHDVGYDTACPPRVWESDGSGRGETEGEVVGYNTLNGDNYGGSDGPLPPGARAAFVLAKGGWQAAPASKGKRGRS